MDASSVIPSAASELVPLQAPSVLTLREKGSPAGTSAAHSIVSLQCGSAALAKGNSFSLCSF